MGKEKEESICFKNIRINKGKFINSRLKEINDAMLIDSWLESPDFLLRNDESTYGIEHFVVDQVYLQDFKRSSGRIVDGQLWDTYSENHEDLLSDRFNADKALNSIQEVTQLALDVTTKFDYGVYIQQLTRIYNKHVEKIPRYLERLENYENVKLYFLIELNSLVIPQGQGTIKCFGLREDGANVLIKGNRIIMTYDMLDLFKGQIGVLEGIIIQQYSLLDMKRNMTDEVYIDLTSIEAMKRSLEKQRIDVYRNYCICAPKCKISLNLEDRE